LNRCAVLTVVGAGDSAGAVLESHRRGAPVGTRARPTPSGKGSLNPLTAVLSQLVETAAFGQVLARFGRALSDPTRARLLLALHEAPGYPVELAQLLGVGRQNLSNHLACLRGCGLVVAVPEGRRVRYELADPRLGHALGDLLGLVLPTDPAACPAASTGNCC
jgi:ArsR family transcriptional regulator, cadmium/lead-responsive transcriptional repressor